MNRLIIATATVFGLFGSIVGPVRAEVTAEQVRKAIDRGANFLLLRQRDDGSWPEMVEYPGGVSALCALALLNVGVEADDPRMQKALKYLRKIPPERTYVVALQTMVFARVKLAKDRELVLHNVKRRESAQTDQGPFKGGSDGNRELIRRNVEWLESTQIVQGPFKGSWTYPGIVHAYGDQSNCQFALLALHEAERVGVVANEQTWRLAKGYWEKCQNVDGSWGYTGLPFGTGSMTCAGIASLVFAADQVQPCDARVVGDRIECCVVWPAAKVDHVERGIRWLGQHYSVEHNPNNETWTLYYLYGLERAGRLTARRFIPLPPRLGQPSRADWYREGAEHLVRTQDNASGSWRTLPPRNPQWSHSEEPLIGASFALLFLSKGRWPVLMAKLQYGGADDWNRHRHDVANLTRYVETRWRRDLTWQVIELRLASVDDLIQTPVLYLCGSRSPLPDAPAERKELAQKLRDYIDRGGFLMAEADCGGEAFDRGFRELIEAVFPEPEYKLRPLESEHPIWYAEEKIDPQQLRSVLGIEFGCRTSVIYVPPDPPEGPRPSLSCLWELSRPGRGVTYSDAVQAQVDAAMSLGINVLAYATNHELKTKEDFLRPAAPPQTADRVERGRLDVANLRHPGGCNIAPRALANLMDAAGRELKIRTHVRPELLDITDPALFDYHLVFMHGRTAFHLTDGERQQLKRYIERGGMLFADSICASRAFSESFRREMAAMFPDRKLERIPAGDSLWSTAYRGFNLRTVSRRDPKASVPGKPLEAAILKVPPDLEGIKLGDRWGVVFSPFDLSCALEKENSLECRGYTREDAARIGLNVVLYSLQH